MKVIYKKSLIDRIQDAKLDAALNNKVIEKFVLDKSEWEEICDISERWIKSHGKWCHIVPEKSEVLWFDGIRCEKEKE